MSIFSNLIWKFGERTISQIVSFIVSVILARILLPKDYGTISMVLVFIVIADVFVQSGFGNALIQKRNADNLDFSSVFFLNLLFSTVLYIILYFFAPIISKYYNNQILTPVIRVMGIRIIIGGINSVQQAYVSKHMLFQKFFWATLFGTILSGLIGIFMAYRGFNVWALVIQNLLAAIVNTAILWFTVKWRPINHFSLNRIKGLLSFGWKILFEGLSNTIIGQLRNLIIGKVYTWSDLGYYTKAQQFPSLLVDNVSSAMGSVLFPAMALRQDDREHVKLLMRKSIMISSYILFPLLTGLAVVAKPLITVLITEKWIDSVPYLQIFCLTYASTIGIIPRHQAINAIGRSDVFMIEHIFARSAFILLLIVVYKISIMAIALSGIVSSIILTLTIMFTSKRYNNYTYKEQIFDILPIIILCLVMGVPIYYMQFISLSVTLILCLQIIAGAVIYLGLSVIFKPKSYRMTLVYIMPIINNIRGKK